MKIIAQYNSNGRKSTNASFNDSSENELDIENNQYESSNCYTSITDQG